MTKPRTTADSSLLTFTALLIVAAAVFFKPTPKPELLNVDLLDREKGICAGMYKEGFDWGLQQIPMQQSIWETEDEIFERGHSEAFKAERLYDFVKTFNQ